MEEKMFNEDYLKGMKFLLEVSKEQGINIRMCTWIPHVSKKLSEYNVCYKFWRNVWKQKRLYRVPLCNTWYDVMFHPNKCLFIWDKTHERHSFWHLMLSEVLKTSSIFNSETRTSSRRLCDGERLTILT